MEMFHSPENFIQTSPVSHFKMRFSIWCTLVSAAATNAAYSGDIVKYWYFFYFSLNLALLT